jgi:hypothetical protein
MKPKIEADAIVALAGALCLLVGSYWAFGFGGVLILFGVGLVALSPLGFTRSIVLTREQQEIARFSFPATMTQEEANTAYARNFLELERRGDVSRGESRLVRRLRIVYATYLVNYRNYQTNAMRIVRGVRERMQAVRFK